MIFYYKRAIQDIIDHRFLNAVTIITIAISILIVSAFSLFFVNANEIINSWKKGIRIMAYLKPGVPEVKIAELKQKIKRINGIKDVRFIPKSKALQLLKKQMERQPSLFENLKENPLPDAFEIRLIASSQNQDKVEIIATRLESFPQVDEVEYGKRWLGRFTNFFNLFRLTGYAMGGLFFMATVLIVANTIRLMLWICHFLVALPIVHQSTSYASSLNLSFLLLSLASRNRFYKTYPPFRLFDQAGF